MMSRFSLTEATEKVFAEGVVFSDGVVAFHYIGTPAIHVYGSLEELGQTIVPDSKITFKRLEGPDPDERPRD